MKASINSFESFGLVDGPGIRCVVFFNGCKLRCKYCHNPETWKRLEENYTVDEIVHKVLRCKPYFKSEGGVTFSGGEPLLHSDFIIECAKELKKDNIHICLDTAGVGLGNYDEILQYIDLVMLDIKHTDVNKYKEITGLELKEVESFIDACNRNNKKIWIRQVIVPGIMDNKEYMDSLVNYLKHINNIERIDFLPFHRLGIEKYKKLGITYPYEDKEDMDKDVCNDLYNYFIEEYKKISDN